jgi:translation initiation factor IF-3
MSKLRERKEEHRINDLIRVPQVRVIGCEEEENNGIKITQEAINIAKHLGVDLVEVNPNVNPPICKIIEYSKFKYEIKRKEKEQKQKNKAAETKEIRMGANIGDHDYQFKLKHAKAFLQDGDKVRAVVQFKGRELSHKELGEKVLLQMAQDLEEIGKPEFLPKLEGKKLFISFSPKK